MRRIFTRIFSRLAFLMVAGFAIIAPVNATPPAPKAPLGMLDSGYAVTYKQYSNNLTHGYVVPTPQPDKSVPVGQLEALSDTKEITVQTFDAATGLRVSDVYSRQAQGSSVWIHASY